MSCILGVDTSSSELSVGLLRDGETIVSCSRYVKNSHAEHIAAIIQFVLSSAQCTIEEVTHAAIAVGPGSFTGLRIGISFLKGLLFDRAIPLLPISSLQSLAASLHGDDRSILSLMDARQNRMFLGKFSASQKGFKRLEEDALIEFDQFDAYDDKKSVLLVDTLGYARSTLPKLLSATGRVKTVDTLTLQRGTACARLASGVLEEKKLWKQSSDVLPNYMQLSYAERRCKK